MSHRLLPAALLLALATCVGDSGTGPGADAMVSLPIQPAIIEGPADGTALPVNRIRVVVRAHSVDADGAAVVGEILAEERFDVDPASTSWEIDVRVPLRPGQVEVVVAHFSLIHAAAGEELVEFSGITPPIRITQGASVEPAELDLVRGPLSNLFATDVAIVAPPEVAVVGVPVPLYATATTTAVEAPSVFWVSLDPAVGTVADGVLTGVTEGTVRVAAAAGAHADTVAISVSPAPADPALYLYGSAFAVAEGDTLTLTVVARNGDTATLDGATASLTLPGGFVPTTWEASAGSVDPQPDAFTWAIGAMGAGETHTLTLDLWIDPAAQLVGRAVSVRAEMFLPQTFTDLDLQNNLGGWTVQVLAPPL